MARLTKAEKIALQQAENARIVAEQEEQYLPKLMAALEEATTKSNYELTVHKGQFHLRDRDSDGWRSEVDLSPVYSNADWVALDQLEWDLKVKAEERAEAERRYQVKQAALAKLSKEERELLGL
jgi:hypothetical protein